MEPSYMYIWHAHITSTTWWVSLLWNRVFPRANVAKFYIRLQLICSIFLRASKFSVLKFIEIVILWIYYMASLLASASYCTFVTSLFNFFNYFVWLRITDEGSVPEMCIWSILLMKSDLKWCIHRSWSLFIFQPLHSLGGCHCWWTRKSLRAAKFYGRLQLIRSISRACVKIYWNWIFGIYSPSLLASVCFGTFVIYFFNLFSY